MTQTTETQIQELTSDLQLQHSLQALKNRVEDYNLSKDDVRKFGNLSKKETWAKALATEILKANKPVKTTTDVVEVSPEKALEILDPDFSEDETDPDSDIPFTHPQAVAPITLVGKTIEYFDGNKYYLERLYSSRFLAKELQGDKCYIDCSSMEVIKSLCKGWCKVVEEIHPDLNSKAFLDWAFIEPHQDELANYWDNWQNIYNNAIAKLKTNIKRDSSIFVSTVAEIIINLGKGLGRKCRDLYNLIPIKLRKEAKTLILERKNKIFARCNSFAEMVKASKFLNSL